MKEIFAKISRLPASVGAAAEMGAEAIHNLPYRFVRALPTAPAALARLCTGLAAWLSRTELAAECRGIAAWLEVQAARIHEVPYRIAAWLPTVPGRWARCRAWLEKKDILPRIRILAPLCLAGLILPACIQPIVQKEVTYLLTTGGEPQIIQGEPAKDMKLTGLSVHTGHTGRDTQIVLEAGQKIAITYEGKTKTVTSRRETVANLLRRSHIPYGADEMVVVNTAGQVPTVAVQRAYSYVWERNTMLAYDTQYVPAPLVEKGKETETQPGQYGNRKETFRYIYRPGQEPITQLVSTEITEPDSRIIQRGTKVDEVSRSDRIEKVVYNDDGSGYLLFKSGETMTFSRRVTCNATAYSIGSWTASGLPTKVGHIAVDPKVFPYHTRFYIYTDDGYLVYGNAVAADCGTAIKGYKIDLWFETFDEACDFGRRNCTVFVLD